MTARIAEARRAKRLALAAAVVALWLAGFSGVVQAGCGDYLVGVEQNHRLSATMPIDPPNDHGPVCRSCNVPATPIPPAVVVERAPVEPALPPSDANLVLASCGWSESESKSPRQRLSQTLDRPPKV